MPEPPGNRPKPTLQNRLRGRGPWQEVLGVSFLLLVLLSTLSFAAYTQLDLDGDGLATTREFDLNTSPWRADSDGDGWESERSLSPLSVDSDLDSLRDDRELTLGANPLRPDTDEDGLVDAEEALLDEDDCNGNGIRALSDADDDSDDRPDATEPVQWRCQRDVDNDTIPDGHERAHACIPLADCDADGLADGSENGTEFSPLDPDTFNIGLRDSVAWAFKRSGQPPSTDLDADGIPDAWETASGLIHWGDFNPQPHRTDLLMEFVRVLGPDSARYASLSPAPLYPWLADFFRESAGIHLQYVETTLNLPEELRPPLLPTHSSTYYRDVLAGSTYASNPYVSTIVMNPQHDQTQALHLGVAPIRGMLAAVDVGAHAAVRFSNASGTVSITLSPFWESLIAGGRTDAILANGFDGGGRNADGTFYLDTTDSRGTPARVQWTPYWFRTPPVVITSTGTRIQLQEESRLLDLDELATTTLHEIGHTLGLCHTELASCHANLSAADRIDYRLSTMWSGAPAGTLNFLASEWGTIRGFIRCAPEQPIVLLAGNATQNQLLSAKYAYSFENATSANVRECKDYSPIPADLDPDLFPFRYEPPPELRDAPRYGNSARSTVAYVVGSETASLLVAGIPLMLRGSRRGRQGAS